MSEPGQMPTAEQLMPSSPSSSPLPPSHLDEIFNGFIHTERRTWRMMRFQYPKRIFRIGNLGVLVRDTEMPSNLFQPRRPRKRLDV